ncbi:MAG: hypothetical protein AAFP86_13470, partial [Planctomycetota bacterium]
TAALEILIANNAISSLIREGKTHQIMSSMQMGGKEGMRLLNDSLAALVAEGTVAPDEAYIKAVDKGGLVSAMNARGVQWSPEMMGVAEQASPAPAPAQQPAMQIQQQPAPQAPLPQDAGDGQPAPGAPPVGDPFEQFKKLRG